MPDHSQPVQNHIHMDLAANIGGAPENSPVLKWTIKDRSIVMEIFVSLDRGWTNKPFFGAVVDEDTGQPALNENMRYTLRVTSSELETLKTLAGRMLACCDNFHPADDADHTDHIFYAYLTKFDYAGKYDPLLRWHDINILLQPVEAPT